MLPKTKHATLLMAIGLSTALIVVWQSGIEKRNSSISSNTDSVRPDLKVAGPAPKQIPESPAANNTEPDAVIVEDRIQRKQDDDVLAEWGEFVVFRRVATNCRSELVRTNEPNISNESVWRCDAKTVPDHPYANFTDEQLKLITSTDGVAALILGKRLRERATTIEGYQEAIQYLYSAVALTGEPEVFQTLMNEQGILFGTQAGNPAQDLAEKSKAYVWAKAGNELGLVNGQSLRKAKGAIEAIAPDKVNELNEAATLLAASLQSERFDRTGERF